MRVVLLGCLVACGTSTNYGSPTAQTEIELTQNGGFAGPANSQSVRVLGTDVVFGFGQASETTVVSTDSVAAIIHTLEAINYLDLPSDFTTCPVPATDAPTATFHITLSAGANDVVDYLGCNGGRFDDLATARTTIFDRSGYTAWRSGF